MGVEIGQTVGDYEVIGTLGAGGMGRVFKVRNLISDRVDAMKVLLPDLRGSAELADRFLNEIKVLAHLRHLNIAALHTALRVDNQLLMIMELVDGANLEERLSTGPLDIGLAVSAVCQVLSALSYAHARGVIHRDIKPANIAIDSQDVVKLLDFGIARGAADRHLTHTGIVLGSLYYMSPEQVMGRPADARSDLYSVGLTLYRAVTGKRPIDGESEYAVMRAQTTLMPDPPERWRPEIPAGLSIAILRAVAKAPGERFQTAEEFRLALESMQALPCQSAGRFHTSALALFETNLAHWLGPIAGPMVRKHSRKAGTTDELCRSLADQIPDESNRRAFLKACAGSFPSSEAATVVDNTPAATQPVAWEPAMLERARKDLAHYVGPLAKVMVDRAAKKARGPEEFYALLGDGISSPEDRRRFLATRETDA